MSDVEQRDEFPEPPSEDDIESKLRDAKARIQSARSKPKTRTTMDLDPETSRGMGVGLAAAYAIIGLPLAGALLGWLGDNAAGTKNVFTMVGVLLGGIVGVMHAVRLSNRQL